MTAAIDITTEQRKTLLALLRRFIPGIAVWAYGSRVKWTARPDSDLDLVAFTTPPQRHLVSELKEALEESNLPFLVDLHVWDEVPEKFRSNIEKEHVVLQEAKHAEVGLGMTGEWQTVPFERLLVEPVRNGIYKAKEFHGRGVNIVNMGELFAHPRLRAVPMKRVELSTSETERFMLAEGDLIFARRSLTAEGAGKCSIVLDIDEPTTFESSIIRARPDRLRVEPLYLYYFFNSAAGFHSLDTIRRQVAVAGITGSDLSRLEIPVPSLPEQRAIAYILGTLDDKIELNRRMNETLEAIARALFKSWFVDFDPVRAKAEGRLPAGRQATPPAAQPGVWFVYALECENESIYIGHTEDVMRRFKEHVSGKGAEWTKAHAPRRIVYCEELPTRDAAVAREKKLKTGSGREWLKAEISRRDLFPDSFEDSELGEIPKGWQVQRFADTVDIIGGGTPKTSVAAYWDGDIPWFSVVDAPSNSEVWVVDTAKKITREGVENSSTRVLSVGTTIISARGTVGRIALVAVPMAMNQSCYGLRGKAGTHGFFTYFATRELVTRLQQHAYGSVFDTITQDTLAGVSLASPPVALIEAFETRVAPALERIRASLLSSRTLAALRDALLPKLISGELRVKDAERFIERAI